MNHAIGLDRQLAKILQLTQALQEIVHIHLSLVSIASDDSNPDTVPGLYASTL